MLGVDALSSLELVLRDNDAAGGRWTAPAERLGSCQPRTEKAADGIGSVARLVRGTSIGAQEIG